MAVKYRATQDFSVSRGPSYREGDVVDDERAPQWARAGLCHESRDLGDMTRQEIYEIAQVRDVPGRSTMSKEELIEWLTTST